MYPVADVYPLLVQAKSLDIDEDSFRFCCQFTVPLCRREGMEFENVPILCVRLGIAHDVLHVTNSL